MSILIENRVGDAWLDSDHHADDTNPSDLREVVATVAMADEKVAARAVLAAANAFPDWRKTSAIDRGKILFEAAKLLRERTADIAEDIAREMGKTVAEATGEVGKSAEMFEYYAGLGRAPYGELLADGRPNTTAAAQREPIGVVVAITPWNDPLLTPARKLAPALIAGNSVVLKPATDSPMAAHHLVRVLIDAGLPNGVLNLVTGRSSLVGPALLDHPAVSAVTFTGSTSVGYGIQRQLTGRPVRVQTELGGKNAAYVTDSADLDLAVDAIMDSAFRQAGQRCTATSRVVVDSVVYDEVISRLTNAVGAIRVGSATGAGVDMGPLVNAGALESVLKDVADARSDGGVVAIGGSSPTGEAFRHGCYMAPTIIADVDAGMRVWRDEVFGPVLVVQRVTSFEQAVAAVNDSAYGLAAAIYTTDFNAAERFIDAADVGQVSVNLPTPGWDVHLPFGGFKDSGSAFKEQGITGLQFYTRTKSWAVRYLA